MTGVQYWPPIVPVNHRNFGLPAAAERCKNSQRQLDQSARNDRPYAGITGLKLKPLLSQVLIAVPARPCSSQL
jgi:hypothetical protein